MSKRQVFFYLIVDENCETIIFLIAARLIEDIRTNEDILNE